MSTIASVDVTKSVKVMCSPKKAFEFVSDCTHTKDLYPNLKSATEVGENLWRWQMNKIAFAGIEHEVAYTVEYEKDGTAGITWQPKAGEGNAQVRGGWSIQPEGGDTCTIKIEIAGDFEVPIPRLMKSMAEGAIGNELNSQLDQYIDRIKETLEK